MTKKTMNTATQIGAGLPEAETGARSVMESVGYRERIREKIRAAQAEKAEKSTKLNSWRESMRQARNTIYGYTQDGKITGDEVDARYHAELSRARAAVSHLSEQIASAEKRCKTLDEEINSLKDALRTSSDGDGVTIDEVLDYQRALDDAQEKANQIAAMTDEQEKLIREVTENMPTQSTLYARREDVAADVALGKATEEDLAALDAQIAQEEQRTEQTRSELLAKGERAHQVIAGLRRRQAEAAREVVALKAMGTEVYSMFLMTLAEEAGAQYMQYARNLIDLYGRLVAIDQALLNLKHPNGPRPQTGPVMLADYGARPLDIPLLQLKACTTAACCENASGPMYFSGQTMKREELTNGLLGELRKSGVRI